MSAGQTASPASFRFGPVALYPVERKLIVEGRVVSVGARAFDVLLKLVEHRERLVTRDELLDAVWPDLAVEPNNLAVQIGALRKVLGPDFIATIPGRGYRLSVAIAGPQTAPVPVGPAVRMRANLPALPAPLIGRNADLDAVGQLIDRHRLVTITGAGGIGKTRLAQRALHQRREAFPHGVCWIDLAAVDDSAALHGTIAAALDIQLGEGGSEALLWSTMASLDILIALDNAEHLLDPIGRIVDTLLGSAPHVRLLVTSHAPLRLLHEHVYRLDALAVPSIGVPLHAMRDYGAIELFVQRAQAADARFTLRDDNRDAVIRLCRALDGLPLAIELAAARAAALGVDRIHVLLAERLRLLSGGFRYAPARQRTMRAMLDWGHHLLAVDEQIVFRRLAVVSGSASLELVRHICADGVDAIDGGRPALDRWQVVDILGTLVERSLVTLVANELDVDRPRYRLLELPRAYARELLEEAGESEPLRARHAAAVAALYARAWTDRWDGTIGFQDLIRALEPDRDNARVAVAWALQHQALDLVLQLAPVMLSRLLSGATFADRSLLCDALERALLDRPLHADQLPARLQMIKFRANQDTECSLIDARQALTLATDADDRFAAYYVHAWEVRVHARRGDREAARAVLRRVDELEDSHWPAARLWMGAEAHTALHLGEDAPGALVNALREELRIARLAGDNGFVIMANMIDAELVDGRPAVAAEHARELLAAIGESRNDFSLLITRINLAAALLALDDVDGARPVLAAAWKAAPGSGVEADCADYLALLAAIEGRSSDAATLAGYADAIYARRGTGRWPNEGRAHDRATSLARAALGEPTFERLSRQGSHFCTDDVASLVGDVERHIRV